MDAQVRGREPESGVKITPKSTNPIWVYRKFYINNIYRDCLLLSPWDRTTNSHIALHHNVPVCHLHQSWEASNLPFDSKYKAQEAAQSELDCIHPIRTRR
ncbi:hypothetical protein PTI98_002271 [Pleurotus ostreatus]|nr:hypothetical protein PTI98_002271 [Pleurotus ostreatus]